MNPAPTRDSSIFEPGCVPIFDAPPTIESNWYLLDFNIQQQQKTNWCWAAVAASVALFYRSSSAVTQCSIANGQLRRHDCCESNGDADDPCNVYGYLMSSLFRVGHFEKWTARQPASSDQIHEEINQRRPLCARIVWVGGGAHLVTIKGYADKPVEHDKLTVDGLAIADPWWGLSDIDAEDFPRRYSNCGTCTDNYYTKA